MPASDPANPAAAPNRSRWMHQGSDSMAAGDWAGAIRAYGQGLIEQPLLGMHFLGMHYAANLERARKRWRQERHAITQQGPAHAQLVVAASELRHSEAELLLDFPQLTHEDVLACLAFAAEREKRLITSAAAV